MAPFGKFGELRRAVYAGLMASCGAAFMFSAGCNREGSATTSRATDAADAKSSASARKTTAPDTSSEMSDDKIIADVSKQSAPRGPAAVFVKYQDLTAQWDAPPKAADAKVADKKMEAMFKTPRLRRRVKLFSDDSTVNDGKYEEWYSNGQMLQTGEYVDGLRQGPWTLSHENGKLRRIEKYLNGKLEGKWKTFRDDGSLEAEVSYHDNQRDGRWTTYATDGKTPVLQEEYKAGIKEGTWIRFFADGKKQTEERFHDGKRDGEQIAWYENGQKRTVQPFKNDQLNGKEIRWKETGEKTKEIQWEKGQIVSTSSTAPAEK